MKDLTRDSITLHILTMSAPVAVVMLVHVAHQLITLYFIGGIGAHAVAGVTAAGNIGFIVAALAQALSVGTAALVAHGAGQKDYQAISAVHGQSMILALVCAVGTLFSLYLLMPFYMAALSTDADVRDAGITFLWWASPAYGLLFFFMVLSATLRGLGIMSVTMAASVCIIVADAALAFLLIPGHAYVPAFGLEGAGAAATISHVLGVAVLWVYIHRTQRTVITHPERLSPKLDVWRRIFSIGLPAGAELALMFLSIAVVYLVIRQEGAAIQAGFGIGFRVLQTILLPAAAIAFAAAPIAGQNFGARNSLRVREVFRTTTVIITIVSLITTALVQWQPMVLLSIFDADIAATLTAKLFLQLMSWTFVAQGLVYTCAYMFQALGNTMPALISALARFIVFSLPAVWLSQQTDFRADQIWYLFTASVAVQAVFSLWLLQAEFKRKLQPSAT